MQSTFSTPSSDKTDKQTRQANTWSLVRHAPAALKTLESILGQPNPLWMHLCPQYPKNIFHPTVPTTHCTKTEDFYFPELRYITNRTSYVFNSPKILQNHHHHFGDITPYINFYKEPIAHIACIDAEFSQPGILKGDNLTTLLSHTGIVILHYIEDSPFTNKKSINAWENILEHSYTKITTLQETGAIFTDENGCNLLNHIHGNHGNANLHEKWKKQEHAKNQNAIITHATTQHTIETIDKVTAKAKALSTLLARKHNLTGKTIKKLEEKINSQAQKITTAAIENSRHSIAWQIRQNANFLKSLVTGTTIPTQEEPNLWTPGKTEQYLKNQKETLWNQAWAQAKNENFTPITPQRAATILQSSYVENPEQHAQTLVQIDTQYLETLNKANTGTPTEILENLEAFITQLTNERSQQVKTRDELQPKITLNNDAYQSWKLNEIRRLHDQALIKHRNVDIYISTVQLNAFHCTYFHYHEPKILEASNLADACPHQHPFPKIFDLDPNEHLTHEQIAKLTHYQQELIHPNPTPEVRIANLLKQCQSFWRARPRIVNIKNVPVLDAEKLQPPTIKISNQLTPQHNIAAQIQIALDNRFNLYNPVLCKETPTQEALLTGPVIIAQGYQFAQDQLTSLDYTCIIPDDVANRIEKARMRSLRNQTPNRELYGVECLAYYNYGPYTATNDLLDPDGNLVWKAGKQYLITPKKQNWAAPSKNFSTLDCNTDTS